MFKSYLQEVKEAVINSDIFDCSDCNIYLEFDNDSTRYNNLPVRAGRLIYGNTVIADIYVSAIPRPDMQFYEEDIHNSVTGFDVISVTDTTVYYMIGCWRLGYISYQKPLDAYESGSNFLAVYCEYLKSIEKIHNEEYDNDFEEET